jgi:hypothetical protein
MTKLAQIIAREEGFGIPGKIPTMRHNPGDLRHSPHSEHPGGPAHKDDIGTIDTNTDGWADLERQLVIFANEGMTLRSMIFDVYAPPSENNSQAYLDFICAGLGLGPETPVSEALKLIA